MGWGSFRRSFKKSVSNYADFAAHAATLQYGKAKDDFSRHVASGAAALGGTDIDFDGGGEAPDQPNVEFNLDYPFSSEGEFSKGAQKARSGTSLEREDLIAAFVDKNTITAGDFSQGSGAVF